MTEGTLLERSASLRRAIEELVQLRSMADQAQAFATRAEKVCAPADQLDAWSVLVQMFRAQGIPVEVDRERAQGLRAQAQSLANAYAEKPDSILVSDGQLRFRFWDLLEQFPQQLRAALLSAWSGYVDERLPLRQDGLLTTLQRLPGAADGVANLRLLWQRTEGLKQRVPTQSDDFQQPEHLAVQITEGMQQLTGGSLPGDVQTFIEAATSTSGAALALFTPSVQEWLARTGNSDDVRVILRSAR